MTDIDDLSDSEQYNEDDFVVGSPSVDKEDTKQDDEPTNYLDVVSIRWLAQIRCRVPVPVWSRSKVPCRMRLVH